MSNEIVSRLLKNRSSLYLKESLKLHEADADDEYAELNDEDPGEDIPEDSGDIDELGDNEIEDDSTAPEQGTPDSAPPKSIPHIGGGSPDESSDEEEEKPEKKIYTKTEEYENPLDNQYAVHFTLGDDVSLSYNGDNQDTRDGIIDGYDAEGFYRVKWSDGTTTNGLTDIALEELVKVVHECVCGSKDFLDEGKYTVCDKCGRRIKENASLLLADKDRPKGKKLIRSEAHPISTAVKPSIAESIRKALKRNTESIKESEYDDDEDYIEESAFDKLKSLDNQFWTRQNELKEDIEDLGYNVEEINAEYVVVSSEEDEDNAYYIPLGGTSRTMTLNFSRARMV